MRAFVVHQPDGRSCQAETHPPPTAAPGLVQIRVAAAGVIFPDLLVTQGRYQIQPTPPFVPGWEVAGTVVSAPAGVDVEVGQRVMALTEFGGWAETVVTHPAYVAPLPEHLSFHEGAALPVNYLTMDYALRVRAGMRPGQQVLVHGAAGGLGTATLQLAAAMGMRTIAVVSSPEKAEFARSAGADEVVGADGFHGQVMDLTGGQGVDAVADPVGGDRFLDSLRCLRAHGKLLVLGFTDGGIPTIAVNRLLLRNVDVLGVAWGHYMLPRYEAIRAQWDVLTQHLEARHLTPLVTAAYPLDEANLALAALSNRRATGKQVLDLGIPDPPTSSSGAG